MDAAIKNGTIDKLNRLLSAVHLLHSVAASMMADGELKLGKAGLLMGELKQNHNRILKEQDRYFAYFAKMFGGGKRDMFKATDDFYEIFNNFINGKPINWDPKKGGMTCEK